MTWERPDYECNECHTDYKLTIGERAIVILSITAAYAVVGAVVYGILHLLGIA